MGLQILCVLVIYMLQKTILTLQKYSYMFMSSLRGSTAYYKSALLNLLAMMKNLGPPHLLVTLSANEMECAEMACFLNPELFDPNVDLSNMREKVKMDPLFVIMHIERRLNALFKYVINGPTKPLGGKLVDYLIRREFQQRGCVHFHCLFWIENFLMPGNSPKTLERKYGHQVNWWCNGCSNVCFLLC